MVSIMDLWLPVLLSGVVVFIASALAWTVMPHHKPEWNKAPIEDEILAGIKNSNVAPGQYMFPYVECGKDMQDPDNKARWEAGPWGSLIVFPGLPSMGRNMGLSFVFYIFVSVVVAYVCTIGLQQGAEYMQVFQLAGVTAFAAYGLGGIPTGIWFGAPMRTFITNAFDALVYALLTAGLFGWLWPALETGAAAIPGAG